MSPVGGSWVTKPRYQIPAALFILVCIIGVWGSGRLEIKSERDQRQDDFAVESLIRDKKIETSQVDIACAFINGLKKAFKPGSIEGVTDESRKKSIIDNNAQRAAAIVTFYGEMPPDIINKINKNCPPETG